MTDRIRVLVIDDSAFARKVIRDVLESSEGIEVVGTARDGLDGVEMIASLSPDVITLDLVMPNLDGLGVLEHLRHLDAAPKVVVVTTTASEGELALRALDAGAVEIVRKPTALATDQLYEIEDDLVRKVRVAANTAKKPKGVAPEVATSPEIGRAGRRPRVVVVGASTGGPNALAVLLAALPADLAAPVVVVLHIPAGYTEALAERWNKLCALEVVEAGVGTELIEGRVIVARAGSHMAIKHEGTDHVVVFEDQVVDGYHKPSVDRVLESAVAAYQGDVLGVVLTGMGDDGLRGARAVVAAHGEMLTESRSSCVVYGMPRAIVDAGLSAASVPIEFMAAAIRARV